MPAFTLETAQARLAAYLTAEEKVLVGQAGSIEGRSVTLADLDSIQAGIKLWAARVTDLENRAVGIGRCRNVSPRW